MSYIIYGYYKYKQRVVSSADTEVISLIRKIYNRHKGRYGYRRIHAELIKSHGLQINHKKVLRLMREIGLKSKIRRKK